MQKTKKTEGNRWAILTIMVIGSFISILDSTIINVVIPSITDHFKDGIDKSGWLISGYTLSMSIMLICSGWFARRYGFKKLYITGIAIFTTASFLCVLAPTIDYLILSRMAQGVGSGIIIPLSMSIIAHHFDGKERGLAIGLWIMAVGISVSVGPFLGGYFVEIGKWDWVFKINIPTGIIIGFVALYFMDEYREYKNYRFDFIGFILLLIWAPLSLYILSTNSSLLLILAFMLSFGLFVLRMIYADNPLINVNIFRNRDFVLAFIIMAGFGAVLQGGNYILSQYLMHGLHYSAYTVGLMFVPVGIIQGGIAPFIGFLTHKYGNRTFIALGLSITLLYLALSSTFTIDTPHWFIALTLYLRGIGIGLSLTAIMNLSLDNAKQTEIDAVSGVINTVKQLSGSYAIAIIGLIIGFKANQDNIVSSKGYLHANDESFVMFSCLIIIALISLFLIKKRDINV